MYLQRLASANDQLENMMRLTVENENLKKRLGVDQGVDLLSEAQERARLLEKRVYESDAIRRRLHNKIQELRGNVRVAGEFRFFDTYIFYLFLYGAPTLRSDNRYYWEIVMACRKIVIVAIGVFGSLTDTKSQVHGALVSERKRRGSSVVMAVVFV